ncbi:GntR family transcriptional regulator [Arenicella xantha]|uniref:GntR family transcriptional regulator n=1 Tax=Arenicella xantha TaxID=644221 RepID=A0A395JJI3_9GAMM|nr:GntR family transcriptional regulator [Arenicella xantha]RBP50882.1 GntR family transcriptional regulator [Arenicella xantha]
MLEANNNVSDNPPEHSDNTLSGQTTTALREAIVTGQIRPGEKLNEPRLAEQFHVSRGPLREAIRRLVAMRLVRHIPHVGATVVTMSPNSIKDLYEVREVLEGKAAGLAALNMTDEQITQLRKLLEIHRHHTETNAGEYMQAEGDFDFHYQIIKGCGNALLANQLCDELYHLIRMFRFQTSRFKARSNRALIEHDQLIYAIELRDAELSEMLMRKHIARAKTSILNSLATQS